MAVSHPPLQHQQRADSSDSLSLSDLCDLELEGLVRSASSPQHSNSGHDDCRALQGRQEEGALACNLQLQHQLLELQRQLHLLQVQLQQQQQQQPDEMGTALALSAPPDSGKPLQADAHQLAAQVEQLKHRNTRLQAALAQTSVQAAQAAQSATAAQQQAAAAQQEAALLRQQRDAVTARTGSRQAAAAAVPARGSLDGDKARGSREQEWRRLHGELLECSMRCNAAMEQNAGARTPGTAWLQPACCCCDSYCCPLPQERRLPHCAALLLEKKQWLGRLAAAEAEAERCRAEGRDLRLSQLQASTLAGTPRQAEQQAQVQALMQQVLEAQADEAAVRGVLWEARLEQLALCSALAAELRRVHSLQSLRTGAAHGHTASPLRCSFAALRRYLWAAHMPGAGRTPVRPFASLQRPPSRTHTCIAGDLRKQQRLQRRIDKLQEQCQQQALLTAQQQQQQQHDVQGAGSADGCAIAIPPTSAEEAL